jgi:hypothetical protein
MQLPNSRHSPRPAAMTDAHRRWWWPQRWAGLCGRRLVHGGCTVAIVARSVRQVTTAGVVYSSSGPCAELASVVPTLRTYLPDRPITRGIKVNCTGWYTCRVLASSIVDLLPVLCRKGISRARARASEPPAARKTEKLSMHAWTTLPHRFIQE